MRATSAGACVRIGVHKEEQEKQRADVAQRGQRGDEHDQKVAHVYLKIKCCESTMIGCRVSGNHLTDGKMNLGCYGPIFGKVQVVHTVIHKLGTMPRKLLRMPLPLGPQCLLPSI